jgi:hypothetical protein
MHPFMTGKLVVGQNTLLLRATVFSGFALVAGVWLAHPAKRVVSRRK